MKKTTRTERQRGFHTLEVLLALGGLALFCVLFAVYVDYDLKQRSPELNYSLEKHLEAFTTGLEFQALALTAPLPPNDAHAAENLTPSSTTPVSARALADIYYFCSSLREQDESFIVRHVRYPAFARQMAEVAQMCSLMATQKALTYGQLRAFATQQRKRFDIAREQARAERERLVSKHVAELKAKDEREAPERIAKLQAWGKQSN